MTAKQYLMQLKELEDKIQHREQLIEELRVKASGVKAITYDQDRVQTSPANISETVIIKYLGLINKLDNERIKYANLKDTIIREIESMDNHNFSKLLYKRYVEMKSLEQIAVEMCYNYDYIRRIHGWALSCFAKEILTNDDKTI
jgi:hypothetical protein